MHEGQKQRMRSGMIPGSWQHRLKLQLFLKASKAYYILSDASTNLLKYGRALRYIKLSLQCYGKVRTHDHHVLECICSFIIELKENNKIKCTFSYCVTSRCLLFCEQYTASTGAAVSLSVSVSVWGHSADVGPECQK